MSRTQLRRHPARDFPGEKVVIDVFKDGIRDFAVGISCIAEAIPIMQIPYSPSMLVTNHRHSYD